MRAVIKCQIDAFGLYRFFPENPWKNVLKKTGLNHNFNQIDIIRNPFICFFVVDQFTKFLYINQLETILFLNISELKETPLRFMRGFFNREVDCDV